MKFTISILLSLGFFLNSFSQFKSQSSEKEKRLYNYIKDHAVVESESLGFNAVMESQIWKRADSLFRNLSFTKTLAYFHDSSYAVKFYAFLKLLYLNDNLAFDYLKSTIDDTTRLYFTFGDLGGFGRFNQLIVDEYGDFLYYRYKNNWSLDPPERHYFGNKRSHFPKANLKIWEKKYKEFYNLVQVHGLKYQ